MEGIKVEKSWEGEEGGEWGGRRGGEDGKGEGGEEIGKGGWWGRGERLGVAGILKKKKRRRGSRIISREPSISLSVFDVPSCAAQPRCSQRFHRLTHVYVFPF